MNYVICHYAEIGLKGKNRKFFEEKLMENIKKALLQGQSKDSPRTILGVRRISGRILIELPVNKLARSHQFVNNGIREREQIKSALKNVFGVAYFAFAQSCEQKIEAIKEKAVEILKFQNFKTFRIETKRSKKDFYLNSQQVNEQVGEYVLEKLKIKNFTPPLARGEARKLKIKVDLENPDVTCFIEIVEHYAFLYLEKIPGPGGLPVGVSGKAISLLSGGIDSPVASFYGQRRGIEIIFLHFTSYPFAKQQSVEKVKKIVGILNKFQFQATPYINFGKVFLQKTLHREASQSCITGSKLYLVPFTEIQKEILLKTKAKLRVVLYRRFMFRIAEVLARREKAKALITGESVGQVASQTLENIGAIEDAVKLPILRPLIGMDKKDIIEKAREIGTFDVSILPAQDCCSRFLPSHPETKADLREVKKEENKLNIEKLIQEAIKRSQRIEIG